MDRITQLQDEIQQVIIIPSIDNNTLMYSSFAAVDDYVEQYRLLDLTNYIFANKP
jgi:hypothetical protein